MQEQHKQQTVKYQCIICKQFFLSSQAIAGHTKIHYKDGWIKGTHQKKVLVSFFDDQQQQQQSSTDSSIPQQEQIFSESVSNTDSANAHQLTPPLIQTRPKHHFRLRDLKTLARLRGRFTKDEEKVILHLLNGAKEQQQQQGSITDSSTPQQQQIFSGAASNTNSSSDHPFPSPPIQTRPRHHLSLRDMKTLARLRGRLTKDEEKVVLHLLDGARNRKIIK